MKASGQQAATPELLTVDQFAQRIQVSRATIFAWINKNVLARGKHYLKIGRVLRFLWSPDLFETLCLDNAALAPVGPAPRPRQQKKNSPLNWDY